MKRTFATWSLRRPIPTILFFALFCLCGFWGFDNMKIHAMPDVVLPTITVVLTQSGAAPAQIETEIARKVEDALADLENLRHLETLITDGVMKINVRFDLGKDISVAMIEVKDAIDRVRAELPDDVDPPSVTTATAFDEPVLTFVVHSPTLDESALSWWVDNEMANQLTAIPGVGRVERFGGVTREVTVEVDPAMLAGLGMTVADVTEALAREQRLASGGRGQLGAGEQAIRIEATVRQADELLSMPLRLSNGTHFILGAVAKVTDGAAEREQAAMFDGKPAIGFSLYRSIGQDEIALDSAVRQALDRIALQHPDLSITPVANNINYTREQYRGSMDMLFEGALLAVLVVGWFLRDWRATLVAACALPLSIIPTFALMYWLDFSLNTLTLMALAMVVGILVDDAIVEVENIVRHIRQGKSVREATTEAINEIALPVMATTLTLVVIFVPTAMMNSVPGLFFREFGWTAAMAILMSLLVARLVTPLMASYWLKPTSRQDATETRLQRAYLASVGWCLAHRKTTLVIAWCVFAGSLTLVPLLPAGLLPATDRGYINIEFELPPGSGLHAATATAQAAQRAIAGIAGVDHVLITAGQAGTGVATETGRGQLVLVLAPRDRRPAQEYIESMVRLALLDVPGARFSLGSGNDDKQLKLIVASDDQPALHATALAIEQGLRTLPGLASVVSSASMERPEIVIRPDGVRAAERGVSNEVIAQMIRIATYGDIDRRLSKLNLDSRQIPIRVKVPDAMRDDIAAIGSLYVPGRDAQIPLASVASITLRSGPAQIERYDRRRYVTLTAALDHMALGSALASAMALPAAQHLPSTVTLVGAGNAEDMQDLLAGFGIAITLGVLGVYCVLAVLFHDFLHPLTILVALPLSLGGAFIALLAMDGQLNVPALIGLLMLMGIVSKNSILLVEHALHGVHQTGLTAAQAMLAACRTRARPILMTTIAMIAGMLPLALGLGADAGFRQPMAVAVIGGLTTSTALSLLVIPVVFCAVESARAAVRRRLQHLSWRE